MARTVTFDFTSGGLPLTGRVSMAKTEITTAGSKVDLPTAKTAFLDAGIAQIEGIEPTPAVGFRYQVKVEGGNGSVAWFVVEVPAGTTPIDFATLPQVSAVAMPIDQAGAQLETWIQSVRAQATAANDNALLALSKANAMEDPNAEARKLPAGGTAGQILTRTSSVDYEVEWADPAEPLVPAGSVQYVTGDANVQRPTPNTNIMVIFLVPGSVPPAAAIPGVDLWVQIS